ncbi:flagellar basal body-associated protein FliL [Pseudoduganella sp. GCM10020061]|uniref:flagellar basal body-associated protein FliL n=1 Tax=Pseudoduganella sp. GCM10020061 TaxID=3317345 RepID=UPI00362E83F0
MNAKTKSKADSKADAPAVAPKKNMLIIALAGAILAGGGGAAAWYFSQSADGKPAKEEVSNEPAVFVPLEQFVVNLQPEDGDAYLQIALTLQVPNLEQEELLKQNMPKVRSRVLMLLSGKRKSEISTVEGKQQLGREIVAAVKEPFVAKGASPVVSEVLFTSFVIQ